MKLIYANTFTESLTRLTKQEAGAAALAALDLQLDPTGNGKQMHRIERAADGGFWSVRVSRELRLVVHRSGETLLLAYAGHHDDAYRWAERKRLVPHERTGAMQFVEVAVIADQTGPEPFAPAVSAPASPITKTRPFADLSDDALLNVGVPRDWLQPVRDTPDAELFDLLERLPAEAAEALLDAATGGRIEDHIAPKLSGDPFAHPDAQRRFRTIENVDELRLALEQPFEKWAVFLHPAQRTLVERNWSGPTRVAGSAGTGKTIVALHRAVHLARADKSRHVLLTTFSKPLAVALEAKLNILTEADRELRSHVTVKALDQAAYELFSSQFGQPNLPTAGQVRSAIAGAIADGLGNGLTAEFLLEEWTEIADAWQLTSESAYAEVPRIGRKIRLGARQREAAWAVFLSVRDRLSKRKLTTWSALYERLREWFDAGGRFPFTHVVVDEAQDLSVPQARFLAVAGRGRNDALFFAGDLGQRIFHLPFSWAKLGIDIRGRSHCLKVCYRTSHQIRTAADRLLPSSIADMDGVEEGRRGTVSVFDGPNPTVVLFSDQIAERDAVARFLKEHTKGLANANEVAILVRGQAQIGRARAAVAAAGFDSKSNAPVVAMMHDAKGLEFKAVAVMACDEDALPDPERLEAVGDNADLQAAYDMERHLLYVACTRARDDLMLSAVSPGSEFLSDLKW